MSGRGGQIIQKPTQKTFQMKRYDQPAQTTQGWPTIESVLNQFFDDGQSTFYFEEIYRIVYHMCNKHEGKLLYENLQQFLRKRMEQQAASLPLAINDTWAVLAEQWQLLQSRLRLIRDIFIYLDRSYIAQHNIPNVYGMGIILFRQIVCDKLNIKPVGIDRALVEIDRERNGETIDAVSLRTFVKTILDLSVENMTYYKITFEGPYLESTRKFYEQEGDKITSMGLIDFIHRAERRLQEEVTRCTMMLSETTLPLVKQLVCDSLITKHIDTIINSPQGVRTMFEHQQTNELGCLYRILSSVENGIQPLLDEFTRFLERRGQEILTTAKEPEEFVERVIQLNKSALIIITSFSRTAVVDLDQQFDRRRKDAFTQFVNKNPKAPEMLAVSIRKEVDKPATDAREMEVAGRITDFIEVFKFIEDKDRFEAHYKHHLCRAFLLRKHLNNDAERLVLQKLQQVCGFQYTQKLEGMFSDIMISEDQAGGFESYYMQQRDHDQTLPGFSCAPIILTQAFWPVITPVSIRLPPDMERIIELYQNFYLRQHSERKIAWMHGLGMGDLRSYFGRTRYEIEVTTLQMGVLLLFNEKDMFTVTEINTRTQLDMQILFSVINSLAGKAKLLIVKTQDGSDPETAKGLLTLNKTDQVTVNTELTRKKKKFSVVAEMFSFFSPLKEDEEKVEKKVDETRTIELESTIMRIMKTRKTMPISELLSEVERQLTNRFKPTRRQISLRMDSLIERSYLNRNEEDRNNIDYQA